MKGRRTLERFNEYKLGWLRDSLFFIAAIAAVFVLFRFFIGLSVVGGDSMYPTLKDGNIVMYLRIAGGYRQGDVISMRVPSGDYYIKRVAAVGGEVVDIYDGSVHVDGKARDDSHAKGQSNYEEEQKNEEDSNAVKYRMPAVIASLGAAIISVIVFLMTEDLTRTMAYTDGYTIMMAVIMLAGIASTVFVRKREDEEERK